MLTLFLNGRFRDAKLIHPILENFQYTVNSIIRFIFQRCYNVIQGCTIFMIITGKFDAVCFYVFFKCSEKIYIRIGRFLLGTFDDNFKTIIL